jgi:surface antigen
MQPRGRYALVSRQWNVFPYGQCTWYADQRFHQLHGIYVPWTSSANAWQWPTRAAEYGWRVSRRPIPGSIIVLQRGVQGASWAGHVGIVERINRNGSVIVSSMNWGARPFAVSHWRFYPGPGVLFVGM